MIAYNVTLGDLHGALAAVNKEKGYHLIFKRGPDAIGKRWSFTLRSYRSKISGASISHSGRNSVAASWHAHGFFFDKLIEINNNAVIKTAHAIYDINRTGRGKWVDYNIGSMMCPMMASEGSIL